MASQPDRHSRVLVVEDNPAERQVLCDLLDDEGFVAIGCATAGQALEHLRGEPFAAAVIDLRLPDLSGTELLGQIRSLDDQIRVIIHTGAASYDSAKDAINLGAFAYVEKLSDPRELLRYVHRACRERIDRYAADLEAAVGERTEELARSNRDLEEFAYVVAHDLRAPLLTISGFSRILAEEYAAHLETAAHEYLGHIVAGVERMGRLIDDLLDYSRAGRGGGPLEPVELDSVVAQARANLDSAIQGSAAEIRAEGLPRVLGDATPLVRLFQNLIHNAIKFRRDVPPVVTISAAREARQWRVTVEDNGIGIEPEHFERIFHLFQQVHRGDRESGTGIGLAVCKRIVERHGGRIWLESGPGRGTIFYFTLPVVPSPVVLPAPTQPVQ